MLVIVLVVFIIGSSSFHLIEVSIADGEREFNGDIELGVGGQWNKPVHPRKKMNDTH